MATAKVTATPNELVLIMRSATYFSVCQPTTIPVTQHSVLLTFPWLAVLAHNQSGSKTTASISGKVGLLIHMQKEGQTGNRTQILGIRIRCTNRYTIQP